MWSVTCSQCQQRISLDVAYCPHCGALQKLNGRQTALRVALKAASGAIVGGIVGTLCLALVAILLAVGGHGFSRFNKTLSVALPVGALAGAILGCMVRAVHEANRWE
jgi:hypothetical protein